MRIYWSIYCTPELRNLPWRARWRLWRQAQDLGAFSAKRTMALLAVILGSVIVVLLVWMLDLPGSLQIAANTGLGMIGVLVAVLIQQWHIRLYRPMLRGLRERDDGEDCSNGDSLIR
jgi:hypothetical protein